MNKGWPGAKARYEDTPVPQSLPFVVQAALREGERRRRGRAALCPLHGPSPSLHSIRHLSPPFCFTLDEKRGPASAGPPQRVE